MFGSEWTALGCIDPSCYYYYYYYYYYFIITIITIIIINIINIFIYLANK